MDKYLNKPSFILFVIILAQFCCTSLWFASNGILFDLIDEFGLEESAIGYLTISVQLGFIFGTLIYAFFSIADRYVSTSVFFISAIMGASANVAIVIEGNAYIHLLLCRFITGFFLAGIYPVGMKIASDHFEKGLGKSLGFLVGALVLGTAFPHLLKGFPSLIDWKLVIYITSSLAFFGGLLLYVCVPKGLYYQKSKKLDYTIILKVFEDDKFKSAAFGYFGHMWELYSFWTFLPVILITYQMYNTTSDFDVSILSFYIIAIGSLSCVVAGYLSEYFGTKLTASLFLLSSSICCLISPCIFTVFTENIFLDFMFFWSFVVIGDSPLFSTLVAQNTLSKHKGTALTIVTSIGFAITIISIQILTLLLHTYEIQQILIILSIGPCLGLIAMIKNR